MQHLIKLACFQKASVSMLGYQKGDRLTAESLQQEI